MSKQNEITLRQFEQLQIRYRESTEDDEAKDNALRPLSYEDALIVDAALGKGNPTDVLASSNFTSGTSQRSLNLHMFRYPLIVEFAGIVEARMLNPVCVGCINCFSTKLRELRC